MLDGLDAIDWGALTHAYGSAADLPKLLRDLARPGADHVDVLDELVMLVFEFGRVYDATVAVMPFLLELARDPARTDRARLVSELAEFAYLDGFGWQQAREVAPTDRCAQARATLATARPTVLRLVEDPAPGVRHAAVRLLLADREHDASTARLLRRRFPDELAWLRHELLAVLAELADAPASWFLATARTDPDPTVRAAAMAAALRLSGTEGAAEVRDAAMSLLREVYAEEAPTPHTGQSAPTNPNHRAPEPAPTPATLPPEPAPPPAGPDRRTTEATPAPVGPDGCTAEVASELPEAAPVSVGLDGRGPETAPVVRELGLALGERVADRATLLIDLLRGSSVRARVEAVPVAAAAVRDWRGDHRELIVAIGEQLDHESDTVRHCAAAALAGFGRLAVFAADPLARRLAVEPAATGTDGLGALLVSASEPPRLGPVLAALVNARDPRALPALAVALRQPRPPVYLGSRIAGFGPVAAELLPLLLPRLSDPALSEYDRAGLITTVLALGAEPLSTAQALLGREPDRHVLEALGRLGSEVLVLAEPLLRAKLDAAVPAERIAAAGAWWRLHRDEAALAILVEQLAAESASAALATRLLGEIGPAAATAVPALRGRLAADRDPRSTAHAAMALWRVTGDPGELVPTVRRLWAEHPFLRGAFAECLAAMGSGAAAVLSLVRDESAEPRRYFVHDGKPTTIDIDADERLSRDCRAILAACAEG